jgi:methionyl-tRNA synthetase
MKPLSALTVYTTTPIFYVNAKPHLGHFYSMTLADVRNRWCKFNNRETFFTTGTDEHGLKVQNAAQAANIDPKVFCDGLAAKFKDLAKLGNINYNRFIRTTDKDHYDAVHYFWKTVEKNNYIYKGRHSGWYSVSDETFFPETDIEEVVDEKSAKKIMISKETQNEVIFQSEDNYFFKLSNFQQLLLDYLKANPTFIQPKKYYDFIINELETRQLPDLSISRSASRLQWGIPVPADDSQKIYVWFDALVNYLTSEGYPTAKEMPRPTHLIGKDIIKFHCIYWPAFLMAAGIQLPKQVFVHGHWLMGGRKMSKSRGNVADPVEISNYYDTDALRLFMMKYSVLDTDGDYSEERLNSLRSEFIDKFCNLMIRSLSKNFNIERALTRLESKTFENLLNEVNEDSFKNHLLSIQTQINELKTDIDDDITNFEMHKAVQKIFNMGPIVNGLFDTFEPWKLKVKKDDPEYLSSIKELKQDLIIFTALDSLRVILILLQSIAPEYSNLLLDRLKVDLNKRKIEYATIASDLTYGKNATFKKGTPVPLTKLELKVE